ncbi:TTN [Acanthosepion pharaonis]|uniref:TTN n=1 Tax=Acanthosepion pharaonis TaxID=158019 RepID=A0A812D707_ACAPH|nr:TTN [Sepia pharaonis]
MVSMIEEAKELEEKPEVESLPSTKEITIGEEQLISIIATEKTIDTEAMEAVVSIKKDSLSDEEFFEVLSTEVKETEFEEIKPEETKIAITATTKTLVAEDITPEFRDTVKKVCEEAEVQPQSDEVLISEMEQIITPSHKETILADSEETGKEISTITLKSDLEIKPKVSDEIPKELSTISILTVASEDSDITAVEKVTDIIPTIEEEAKADEIITTEPLEITVSSSATSVTKEEVDKLTESTTLDVIPHEEMKPQSEELQITLTSAAVAPTEKTIVAISEETKPEEKISVVAAEPQIPQVSEFVLPVVEQAKITSKITTSIKEGEAPVSDEKVKDIPSQITINIESKEISTEKQEPLIGKVEETFIYEDEEKESGDEVFDVPEESTEKVTLQQIQSGDLQISVKSEMVSMIEEAKELEEKPEVESLPSTKEITIGEEQLISIIATEKTIDTEAMEAVVSIKKDSLSDEEFFEVPSTEVKETEFEEIKPEETKIAITATTKTLLAEDITPEIKDIVEKICEETEVQPQSDEVLISESIVAIRHIFVEPKKKLPGPKDVQSLKEDNLVLKREDTSYFAQSEITDVMKPSFIKKPSSEIRADKHTNAKIEYTVLANPEPTFTWFHDGSRINLEEKRYHFDVNKEAQMYNLCLNIDDIGVQDSGRYTVVISNIAGKDSFTVKLTIDDEDYDDFIDASELIDISEKESALVIEVKKPGDMAPVFEIFLFNQTVDEAESVSFVCTYKGQPLPDIEWRFNGSPIQDGEIYHIIPEQGKSTLMIPEVYPEDAGTYTVKAFNKYGEAQSSCVLDVIEFSDEEEVVAAEAATKIQAAFRGFKTRKEMKKITTVTATQETVELVQPETVEEPAQKKIMEIISEAKPEMISQILKVSRLLVLAYQAWLLILNQLNWQQLKQMLFEKMCLT